MGRHLPLLTACLLAIVSLAAFASDPFPAVSGWSAGETAHYAPDNLFEYINGAAESFLACDFRSLAVRIYENGQQAQLTAEIYRHADPLAAFAIYSAERPLEGDYLPIGAEGYYEQGVLNFLSGNVYVKLSSFDLGAADRSTLLAFATAIQQRLGPSSLPPELGLLPVSDRKPHSERFILKDFLGQPFLGSALLADYGEGQAAFRIFILLNPDEAAAATRLARWLALYPPASAPSETSEPLIHDPHNGPIRMLKHGRFLAGAIGISDGEWSARRIELRKRLAGTAGPH